MLGTKRRTHKDPTAVRTFEDIQDYWAEVEVRRRYSIPHSDGSFFSDGSGYSNGPQADLHYEIIERINEAIARLELIAKTQLDVERELSTNTDFIPHAAEIEADIRLARQAASEIDDDDVSDHTLSEWLKTFGHLASKYLGKAGALCGLFFENAAIEAGKQFGSVVVGTGGLALSLYLAGVDFQGIMLAISALLASREVAK